MTRQQSLARLDALAESHHIRFSLTQLRILLFLADRPFATFTEIAKGLGVKDTQLRDPLDSLCEVSRRKRGNLGLVKRRTESTRNRYSLTAKGKRAIRYL